ncbi:UPF0182 family protein [Georgenia muralis]|uniref:UPF0182 protein EDD32_0163 n=1 Tax=Georgenia muralis TaxID=154117 RepID=A0A3N5A1J1_9MICO|nr:UPF0182 family protein [Georgenia muralis]RPF25751.1 hypothetical protein EDD32_0163 [Georgenia muralis]
MTSPSVPRPPSQNGPAPRRGALVPTIVVLAVLAAVVMGLAQVWTEIQWFNQLGFTDVLIREWTTRGALFALGFLLMGGAVWLNLHLAYSQRQVYPPTTPEERNLDKYRESIEPLRRLIMIGAPLVLGLFAGSSLSAQWREVLTFLNREQFGIDDPQFGLDIGFFVFTLPVIRMLISFLMTVVFLSAAAAVVTHYLYGGISLAPRAQRISPAARLHLGILAAVFVLLIAASYWLDRYSVLVGENARFAGASYTDVNANIPAKAILAGIAVVVAVLFVVAAFRGTWRLPVAGIGVMIVSAIVVGSAYPAVVQRFQVEPNAIELEREFIQRNIDGTLAAYDLQDVEVETYSATTEAEAGQLREDSQSTASIRLLDPQIVAPTFNQLQQNRQYYGFPTTLAVDRYEIDGESRDTVIAVRELNQDGLGAEQRTWVNDKTVYTHGFGVVAAYGNTTRSDGRPAFFQQGIPSTGELGEYEPRVYFGQFSPDYSIVGAPEGTDPWELDYPDDDAPNGAVNNTYTGDGGPSIGNIAAKLLYALKFGDMQILFSDRVTEESQILFDRDPHQRVSKVAPYLTLDAKAYPAVVDMDGDEATPKELVWIVDGYTTTNDYPYSARESLEEATTDSLTTVNGVPAAVGVAPAQVNYIRNSVKAVVNAYDGDVTLYEWDEDDPILDTWQNIFGDHVQPVEDISGDLMSHLRYPEDLFKVQRQLLSEYHVTDAASFYSGSNFWNIPTDPTAAAGVPQPPYYLTMQMPAQDEAQFSLTSSFIPGGQTDRNILTGFLAVDSETGDTAGEVREDYGQMRLLELPSDLTVPGPGQVQNNFNSNPAVSSELNLLRQGNSDVQLGNLLTLPVGGGLLYVQPVYVQSAQGTSYPLLQRVLVSFGDEIGFASTLDEALDEVFGGDSGAEAGDAEVAPPEETPDGEEPDGTTEVPAAAQERLTDALADAQQAIADGNTALAESDWTAYGEAQQRLQSAIEDALAAEAEIADATGEVAPDDEATAEPTAEATEEAAQG